MKSEHFERYGAMLLYGFVVVMSYIRIYFGISIADEALYVTLAQLPILGGKWFVNDLTIQITSAIPLSPFTSLYSLFFDQEGIVLFTRHLYFFSSLLTSLTAFYFIKAFIRWPVALILSSVLIAFTPHMMACLNYNSMGSQYFGMATMLGSMALFQKNKKLAFWSGFFWTVCVFCYPSFALLFLIFSAIVFWRFHSQELKTRFAIPFLIGLILPAVPLAATLVWAGIDNILNAIAFSNNFNMPGQWWKIPYAFETIWRYFPPAWMILSILILWGAAARWKPAFSVYLFFVFLLSYIFFGNSYESQPIQVLWPVLQMSFLMVLLERKLNENEKNLFWLILVPAIIGSLIALLTSRMTLYNMYITGIFGSLAATILLVRSSRWGGLLVSITLSLASLYNYYSVVYEDGPIETLDQQIENGPYKGLYTSRLRAEPIEAVQRDLKSLPEQGTILFKDHFPVGYLMSKHKLIGPTVNILPAFYHPEARPLYVQFYSDPKNLADWIVEFRAFPIKADSTWVFMPTKNEYNDPFYDFFMRTGRYEVILDRGMYRFLRKVR